MPAAVSSSFLRIVAQNSHNSPHYTRVVVNKSARPNSVDVTLGAGDDTCLTGRVTLQRCPERRRGLEGIAATLDNVGKSRLWSASLRILRGHVFAPLSLRDDAVHSRT
jgi:hypothetical protein